jgi:ferredoxin
MRIAPAVSIMKIPVIDLSDCILCGVCQDVCPEVFRLNDAGYIEVTQMPDYPGPCVDEAIKNCPADCIAWE